MATRVLCVLCSGWLGVKRGSGTSFLVSERSKRLESRGLSSRNVSLHEFPNIACE